ncbi:MAG: CatB-related O-acetyltransferase [Chitinophagaceae bacterium]
MSFFKSVYYFFINSFNLLKFCFKPQRIGWQQLSSSATNCNIDQATRLYPRYSLNNVSIGKGSYVAINSNISNTTIGKFCSIGPNFFCGWGVHPTNGVSTSPVFYSTHKPAGFTYSTSNKCEEKKPITIGNDVFIGANVIVLDGITIGDGAIIGAGATVSKDIPPYAIAVGCPIKIIKYRFSPEIIEALLKSRWWDKDEAVLRSVEKHFFNITEFLSEHGNTD